MYRDIVRLLCDRISVYKNFCDKFIVYAYILASLELQELRLAMEAY